MSNRIHDEFSEQGLSKQRRYQLRKARDGLCEICGEPASGRRRCAKHLKDDLERAKKRWLRGERD